MPDEIRCKLCDLKFDELEGCHAHVRDGECFLERLPYLPERKEVLPPPSRRPRKRKGEGSPERHQRAAAESKRRLLAIQDVVREEKEE